VLVGTLYPLALEAVTGQKISVGAPYFNMTFVPLMFPLLLALPFGPMLAWKRGDLGAALSRLFWAVAAAILAAALMFSLFWRGPWLAPFGIALGVWVIAGAISEIAHRCRLGQAPLSEVLRRFANLPRSSHGTAVAHAGVGMMVIGIVATTAWQSEIVVTLKPDQRASIAGYDLEYKGTTTGSGPNYVETSGRLLVTRGGAAVTELLPSKRLYDMPRQATTEAGIHVSWRGDLYAVLGDEQQDGGYAFRFYFNPLVRFIWIGSIVMFLGGGLSLSDRRLRVGAPRAARRRIAAAPAE
jgi:cytochrome c-type biogenesis protein CcmF